MNPNTLTINQKILLPEELHDLLGNIDIYLLDQILKGRFQPGMRVLDAGCGDGRNINYLFKTGFEVYGIDDNPKAIEEIRLNALKFAPKLTSDNFRNEKLEENSFDKNYFDAIICNAVLHFSRDEQHFEEMVTALWRVLKPGGIFFSRLASSIGIEDLIEPLEGRRYFLPDGSERFLVDEALLLSATYELRAKLLEPIKTLNVQNMRCMTTWCLQKIH